MIDFILVFFAIYSVVVTILFMVNDIVKNEFIYNYKKYRTIIDDKDYGYQALASKCIIMIKYIKNCPSLHEMHEMGLTEDEQKIMIALFEEENEYE